MSRPMRESVMSCVAKARRGFAASTKSIASPIFSHGAPTGAASSSMSVCFGIVGKGLCILLVIPGSVYTAAFGKDVTGLRPILLLLAPGILAMAASQAFSHYFSGIGRSRMNMLASGCGMAITVLVGPWAVAHHGTHGAAATASLAYLMAALLQFVAFLRATRAPFAHFWPNAQDLQQARALMRRLLGAG